MAIAFRAIRRVALVGARAAKAACAAVEGIAQLTAQGGTCQHVWVDDIGGTAGRISENLVEDI